MSADQLKDKQLSEGIICLSLSPRVIRLLPYNEELPPFYRAEENSEVFNERENQLHGIDKEWGFRFAQDGTYELVFNEEVEGGGMQQRPLSEWENYHNAELANIPQTVNYRTEPTAVGANNIAVNMQGRDLPWTKAEATSIANDLILGNSEDGMDMRAYTAYKFFTEDMQKNGEIMSAFAAGNMNADVFFKNGQQTETGKQVSQFMQKTVDIMVDGSKYLIEEPEPSGSGRNQDDYVGRMRREETTVEGVTVNVYDPAASNDIAVDKFAGKVGAITGNVQMYTLGDNMDITNFKNPIFGMKDEYEYAIDGSEKQVIKLEDLRKFAVFGPQEGFPKGGIILRDFSIDGKAIPLTVLDNNQESDKTAIDQILQEIRKKGNRSGVEFSDLLGGWEAVKVRDGQSSPTGGTSR